MAWVGPALAAGASLIGSVLGFKGASDQNEANAAIAQKQMDFQKDMSNTSYQRSMKDMKKAGLNPILAYQQGGATTPGGASIAAVNELSNLDNPVSSAIAAKTAVAKLEETAANIKNIKVNSVKAREDAAKSRQEGQLAKANIQLTRTEERNRRQLFGTLVEQTTQAKINTKSSAADFLVRKEEKNLMWDWLTSPAGKKFWHANIIGGSLNPLTSAYKNISR